MRRLVPLVTCLAAAVVTLTGCAAGGSAPAPVRGDVAAVVAGQDIPISQVQDRLRTAAPTLRTLLERQAAQQGTPPAPLDAATLAAQSRALLTTSVLHVLVGQESARQNIVVPPAQVEAMLAEAGGAEALAQRSGFDAQSLRQLVGDQLAVAEIGRRAYDRLAVSADFAQAPDRTTADRLARQIAAGADPGRVFASLPAGTSSTDLTLRPGSTGSGGNSSAVSILFGLPANTVTTTSAARLQQGAAGGQDPGAGPWLVIHVRDRGLTAPPPGPGVTPAAAVDPSSMIDFGLRMLQPSAEAQSVRVNPRFGVWDPTQVEVTTPDGAGTVTPVRAPAP